MNIAFINNKTKDVITSFDDLDCIPFNINDTINIRTNEESDFKSALIRKINQYWDYIGDRESGMSPYIINIYVYVDMID